MKIPLNIIKEYIPNLNLSVDKIAQGVKNSLSEVESIEDLELLYKDIVVAEIINTKEHPNADKLRIYEINTGDNNRVQVVAGDKSLKIGNKVIYLKPGTRVPFNPHPNQFDGIIKTAKIRDIESHGMLASEKELNISNKHESVMALEIDCKAGDHFTEIANLNGYVLEIEKKPLTIRPDTFGFIGFAREIAGIFGIKFNTPNWLKDYSNLKPKTLSKEDLPLQVNNKLDNLCPRYMAISMKNVKVDGSPLWLKTLLSSSGIKPINNVVDITNYLMILTGQPLHAFDYDKLVGKDIHAKNKAFITVRTAQNGEKITTLDEKTVELNNKTVAICDSQHPIAIGGVMGGLDTEIDLNTKNIIIESANFDLYNIRKTSMSLGIVTDAVTRFSKGQDPNLCEPVLYKAIELVTELCGGEIASNVQDVYTELPKDKKLTFSIKYLNKHTGLELRREEIIKILSNVEIGESEREKNKNEDLITIIVPTYRQDLKIPEDIHEEIARLYGYKNIKMTLPQKTVSPTKTNPNILIEKDVRKTLKAFGTNEIITYSFTSKQLYEKCQMNLEHNFRLINPISPELEYMRSSLLPSLIDKININIKNGFNNFALFEINKTHNKLDICKEEKLPLEHKMLSLVYVDKESSTNYYNTKYYLDNLLKQLKSSSVLYEPIEKINTKQLPNNITIKLPLFDRKKTAIISFQRNKEKVILGIIGEINTKVKEAMKIACSFGMIEVSLDHLSKAINQNTEIINFSKYPKIQQDLCFVVDKSLPYAILEQSIKKTLKNRDINYIITPIDIYQDEKINNKKKQITINIAIQHKNRTLKEKDTNSIRQLIEKSTLKDVNAKIKE